MDRLRIVILGLGSAGRAWLDALKSSQQFEVVGLADQDAEAAALAADAVGCPSYDDYRLILIERRPDAAIFALPPFAAEPYLPIAAESGIASLVETPPARTFEDALRLVSWFFDADLPLVVASRWRFDSAVAEFVRSAAQAGRHRLAQATVLAPLVGEPAWRGEAVRSGGGVLLDAAYEAIDLLISLWGLPGDVTSHVGRLGPLIGSRFDTEDTASIFCRYDQGAAFSVSAAWHAGRSSFELSSLAADGGWRLTPTVLQHESVSGESTTLRRRAASEFASAILESFENTIREQPQAYPGRAADQLATAAVLEAAYHSSRTHAPESPARPFELAGLPIPRATPAGGVEGEWTP